ncbi:YceG family protein [Clostridium thermarum]|uniref:YceG family protein n=1 Tax=Clostridium thermarum TaxID=1716543 RepID=UPI00111CEC69|nr:YceG family protein [Clostridium thermarum]
MVDKVDFNKLDIQAINSELSDDMMRDIKTPVKDRRGFNYNSYVISIPRYFYRFLGIKTNEEEYYNNLYKIDRDIRTFTRLYMRFDKGLDRNIGLSMQNKLNEIGKNINFDSGIDSSYIVNAIDNAGLFPSMSNPAFTLQMKNYFKVMLDYYMRTRAELQMQEFKLVLNYGVHWLNLYSKGLFDNFNYIDINPKVLYYGNITPEEAFFLIFLSTLGCDVLYFNPINAGSIAQVDKFNAFSREIIYLNRGEIKDFPQELKDRIKTTAYNAREELNKTLFDESGSFYRPWQFADYSIQSLTMRTTYEEVNLWAKEKAMIRDGWKVENKTVFIPNIFAKISGTHEDIDKYWKEVNEIVEQKNTKFINKLPIIEVVPLEYGKLQQVYPEHGKADFDTNKLMKMSWWKYKELRIGLQRAIAEKIKQLCLNPVVYNVENQPFRDFQVDIFSVLINLDLSMLQLLQSFDYPDQVPKIVIYNNEKNGNVSYEDCIMLSFMNAMGVDIMIYNPSGYTDIETYIYPDIYDVHHLEKVSFNLDFKKYQEKKKGFFKSIFGK